LIDGLCKIGETKIVIQLSRIIESRSTKPNAIMYTSILDSLFKYDIYSEMILKRISPSLVLLILMYRMYIIIEIE